MKLLLIAALCFLAIDAFAQITPPTSGTNTSEAIPDRYIAFTNVCSCGETNINDVPVFDPPHFPMFNFDLMLRTTTDLVSGEWSNLVFDCYIPAYADQRYFDMLPATEEGAERYVDYYTDMPYNGNPIDPPEGITNLVRKIGLPLERIAVPFGMEGEYNVVFWDDSAQKCIGWRPYDHSGYVYFPVPAWDVWYWIGFWDVEYSEWDFGQWVGHFFTEPELH